ncbi:uncharacterized protein LOC142341591 isoform X4 [Convolutriloba macropyga]|uniref:uncharacterized protein LOC142341591 isoform X4 n=1 Tax=Convolutriloba macropyga TaxID=536237 RepID=UPI003F527BF6
MLQMSLFIKIINTMLVLPFIIPLLPRSLYPLYVSCPAIAIVFIILLSLKRCKTDISLAQALFLPTSKAATLALRQVFVQKFIFSNPQTILYSDRVQLIFHLVLLKSYFAIDFFLNLCSAKKLIRPQSKAFLSHLNSNRQSNNQPPFSAKILLVSNNSNKHLRFLHFITIAAASNNWLLVPRTCKFWYTRINFTIILAQIRSQKVSHLELNPKFNPSCLKVNRLKRTKGVNKQVLCLILALNNQKALYVFHRAAKAETNNRPANNYNRVFLPNLLRVIIIVTSRGLGQFDSGFRARLPWQQRTGGKQLSFIIQLSVTSLLFITPTAAQEVYGTDDEWLSYMNYEDFNLTCLYKNFDHPLKIIWKWESKPTSSSSLTRLGSRPDLGSRPQPLKFYKTFRGPDGKVTFTSETDKVRLDRNTELLFNERCDATVAACPAHLSVRDASPLYSGYYSCQVSDTRGSATTMYDVDILEQAPPEDVQLKMLTATAVYKPGGGPSAASTQIIAAGEELTLECSSDGFPSPMIQFMLNGNQIDFEDWITIKDDTRTSEGKYLKRTIKVDDIGLQENSLVWSCQANNLKGYDTSDEIYTQYRYKPTILTGSLQVVKRVRMNSAVDITCEVKPGNPSHTEVSWVQGKDGYGNTVANGNRLLWSGAVVEPAKTGFYTCVASNAIGRSTFTIHIIIEYPPVVQISPTVTSVEEGTELVLVCDIDAEPKEVQIEWGHQSIELQDTHRNVLSIPNVTRSHGGRYTCTVKNEHGSASKSAQVTILYRPNLNFRLQPNKRAFLEGEAVTIICFAQANPQVTELSVYRRDADIPAAVSFWIVGNPDFQPVLDDTNRSPNRKSYTISKLNRTHSGLYRCSAKNTVGRSTEEIDLTVQHVPIIKKLNPQVIDEGQALRVRCDVESEPPAKISWFSPDRRLIKTGQHLVMEKMSQSDAGSYLCKAQNTFYNDIPQIASMEVKVFVRFPPQYLPCSPKNLEGIFSSLPGESAKLCCQFILYPTNQPERVQWFRNTRENSDEITQLKVRTTKVTDDSSEYQVKLRSELTISNVVENNFTDYFCAVKNDKGEQFKKIRLNQLRTPPAPTIQDVKAESNALRVSWSPVSYMTSSDSWYEVGYKPVGKKDYQTKKAGNNNELVITSLKSKQKYDVSVKACNSVGCSEFPPPKQGVADRASGSGGGGSSPGGDSSVAGSNNVPLRTMVIVPLVVFGLVLLISLLIVICRRNRDQRRNAALKKDKNTSRDNYGHIPVPTNSVNGRCGLGVGAIPGVPVVMGVGSVSKSPQLAKAPHQGVHIWGNTSTLPPTSLSSGFSPRLGSAHPHSSALQYNSHVVPTLRLAHNSTNGSLPKDALATNQLSEPSVRLITDPYFRPQASRFLNPNSQMGKQYHPNIVNVATPNHPQFRGPGAFGTQLRPVKFSYDATSRLSSSEARMRSLFLASRMYNSTGVVFYNKNAYLSPEHKPIENQNDKTVLQNDEKDLGDLAQQQHQQQDCSSEHSRQTSDDNY